MPPSPQFLIGEHLATVRAPYDFHVDDRFSHCGLDHFTLVRETDGWRIQGIAYTFASKDQALCQPQTPQP
jgi:aryl carrier-like protein